MAAKYQFLITGTDTGVGKTTVACSLAALFRRRGMRVGVMKPAETGCVTRDGEMIALDAVALRTAAVSNDAIEAICPYRYATPVAPAAAAVVEDREPPDLRRIAAIYERLAADRDVMLVEGAGGIAVPLTWSRELHRPCAIAQSRTYFGGGKSPRLYQRHSTLAGICGTTRRWCQRLYSQRPRGRIIARRANQCGVAGISSTR